MNYREDYDLCIVEEITEEHGGYNNIIDDYYSMQLYYWSHLQ